MFYKRVNSPTIGKSPAMPPWGGVVSPEDIDNVVAHIRQNLCKCEYKKQ